MRDQVLRLYKTTGKITVLYVLNFKRRREDKKTLNKTVASIREI